MRISKHATIFASLAIMVSAVIVGGFNSVSGASGSTKTISVMYWTNFDTPGTNATPKLIKAAATELAKQYPGAKVVLDPITTDSESTYYAKIDLAQRSAATAPD